MAKFDKKTAGDPLSIKAAEYNAFIDAALRNQPGQPTDRTGADESAGSNARTNGVMVKNNSGGSLAIGDPVVVTGFYLDPANNLPQFKKTQVLTVDSYSTGSGPFMVMVTPAADGKVGRAISSGPCALNIDIVDVDHEYAIPTSSGYKSCNSGPIDILWAPASTGNQWCSAHIGTKDGSIRFAKLTADWNDSTTVTGNPCMDESGAGVDVSTTITLYIWSPTTMSYGTGSSDAHGLVNLSANDVVAYLPFTDASGTQRGLLLPVYHEPGDATSDKVATDSSDTTPGYLDDELIVDPGGGAAAWLEKSVTPGGASDNKLLLEHADADVTVADSDDGVTLDTTTTTNAITVTPRYFDFDAKGHFIDAADNAATEQTVGVVPTPGAADKVLTSTGDVIGAWTWDDPSGQVLVTETDTTPSYLDDAIEVESASYTYRWLTTEVEGSGADETLLIRHLPWDLAKSLVSLSDVARLTDQGGGVTTSTSAPAAGYAYIKSEAFTYDEDGCGHSVADEDEDPTYFKWLAVPAGSNTGDMLYWDGSKWVALARPNTSNDYVLMHTSASGLEWVQTSEFSCP